MPTSQYFGEDTPVFQHLVRPKTGLSGEIWKLLQRTKAAFLNMEEHVRTHHEVIVRPGNGSTAPGQTPTIVVSGALQLGSFTLNTDDCYRQFKIPSNFVGNASFHIHWTKTTNANEQGKNVRWKLSWVVFDGHEGGTCNYTPSTTEVEDTYEDSGTTVWKMYSTPNIAVDGDFIAGHYVSLKMEAITPSGTPMAGEPGLYSVDLVYDELINI